MFLTDSSFFEHFRLPSHDEIFSLSEKMCSVLEEEKTVYRAVNEKGEPGALLNFTDKEIPVLLVPDLHARPQFLHNIIYSCPLFLNGLSVLDALEQGLVHLVFLGDALHSEKTRFRWDYAYADYLKGVYSGIAMKEEMEEGLSLLMEVYELKTLFPENFHYLKGNHENILNSDEGGDYPFSKYADEGFMVRAFMRDYYGDDVLYMISYCEKKLPLVYAGKNCIASHAEPFESYTVKQLINGRLESRVTEGLTWTRNDTAMENSVLDTEKNIYGKKIEERKNFFWFTGHRPVKADGNIAYRQNGRLIQIHNPSKMNFFAVRNENGFDPSCDILSGGVYGR